MSAASSASAAAAASRQLTLSRCRRRLAQVWFVAAGICFLSLLVYTVFDGGSPRVHGDAGSPMAEIWNWFLPAFVPSLSLMIGVLLANVEGRAATDAPSGIDPFLFRLAFWISAFYLAAFGLAFVEVLFLVDNARSAIRQSNLWLGPLQGLVTGSLGAFFVRAQQR